MDVKKIKNRYDRYNQAVRWLYPDYTEEDIINYIIDNSTGILEAGLYIYNAFNN